MVLEKVYESYLSGDLKYRELKEKVLEYAYKQVERDRYIEAGDFILRFIPKVDGVLERYNSDFASFKHYINSHIKWLMFSFSKEYKSYKEKSDAYSIHNTATYKDHLSLADERPEYKISPRAKQLLSIKDGSIYKKSSRKRLEIFTLKNIRNIEKEQIEIIAPLINRSVTWLFKQKEYLGQLCEKRISNRNYLQSRYNRLFIEITKDQQKLLEMGDSYEKELLYNNLCDKQRRKRELLEKLKHRNCGPKNDEIAKLLNIPKGTVDSSLYYMKKSLSTLLKEDNID